MFSSPYGLFVRPSLVCVLLGSVSSCDDPTGPEEVRRLGVIDFYGDPIGITVPDTVSVGENFLVSVKTYGNGCVYEDATEVNTAGLSADITPYDRHRVGVNCPDLLREHDHTAVLSLQQPGTATISFHGLKSSGDLEISELREVVVK